MNICVECGTKVPNDALFHDYGEGTIRLTHCPECQNVADKYIEYELILVCIDVILHRKQAFRHFLYNRRSLTHEIKLNRLVGGVLLVSVCLKVALLYNHEAFRVQFYSNPILSLGKVLLSCFLEHAIFSMTVAYALSKSFPPFHGKTQIQDNERLYHALAFPELGKVFVAFLQVWDSEPTMPFIYGALMLSVQYSSLQCVTTDGATPVFKPLFAAIVLRLLCRLCFHSVQYTLMLGVIL